MPIFKFGYKRERRQNPYIGFTSFQHYRNEELYSDLIVKPENHMTETEHVECYPVPDYVEEKGRAQGYYPDCSIVYIRILWKEFEPQRGSYRFDFIDGILKKAEENDQTVMFRIMPHSTRESDDVPDWVKEMIDCPARPEGARVKVSPTDPMFLTLFGNVIRVFGERYDEDPTLAVMDVSLPGAWGEGSSCEFFSERQMKALADIYTSTFKQTLLVGQIIAPWLVNYMNETGNVGWRADGMGEEEHNLRYIPDRAAQMADVWRHAHISGESFWWLGEWKRKGWDIDDIIDRALKWHISTFNAKSLPIPYEWKDKIDAWVSKMGYHFVIREVALPKCAPVGGALQMTLKIDNVGVAPIYHKIPLCVRLKGNGGETVLPTDVDITRWIEGEYTEDITLSLPASLVADEYALSLGICGEGCPTVLFATDAPEENDFAVIGSIKLETV